jgi:hypothetical protein
MTISSQERMTPSSSSFRRRQDIFWCCECNVQWPTIANCEAIIGLPTDDTVGVCLLQR